MYYIAHRLFAAHDRALAAHLAHHLALKLGEEEIFLPFCDTDEEDLVAAIKGQRLFELDRDRLRHIGVLIALAHGPSLDDGVCMETGYAAALGTPVVMVTTDFQDYSVDVADPRTVFPDPLVDTLATQIIRVPGLGLLPTPPGASRFADFAARNHDQVQKAVDACVDAALHLPTPAEPATVLARTGGTVYVEPSPYAPEQKPPGLATPGVTICRPTRFTAHDPQAAARADWIAALGADRILVDASGPETPPGAALLIGAACATSIPVAAYLPRSTYTHACGREPNHRNLMVQYGVDRTLRSAQEVTAWIEG